MSDILTFSAPYPTSESRAVTAQPRPVGPAAPTEPAAPADPDLLDWTVRNWQLEADLVEAGRWLQRGSEHGGFGTAAASVGPGMRLILPPLPQLPAEACFHDTETRPCHRGRPVPAWPAWVGLLVGIGLLAAAPWWWVLLPAAVKPAALLWVMGLTALGPARQLARQATAMGRDRTCGRERRRDGRPT